MVVKNNLYIQHGVCRFPLHEAKALSHCLLNKRSGDSVTMKFLSVFLAVSGIVLSARCNLEQAGFSEEDLMGTWMMSTATMTSTTVMHTAGTGRDSAATDDTTMNFTNSNDYYIFYRDKTYYTQFDDNIIGNTGMMSDSGTWTLRGSTMTTISSQSPAPRTSTVDLNGNNAVITTTVFSDSQPGYNAGDYMLYRLDLAISAAKQ